MVTIRPYRSGDRAAMYDVCVRTAAAGGDARGRYSTDGLMPDLFAGPYLELEPELAFVLDDGRRAVGYVLGTADTPRFVDAYREHWLPGLAQRYPAPPDPPVTAEDTFVAMGLRPERMLLPELASYPAHLHIDLLPAHQGRGHGRELTHIFLGAAATAGADAVHLGMDPANTAAHAFYGRLGFHEISVTGDGATYLGRDTGYRP